LGCWTSHYPFRATKTQSVKDANYPELPESWKGEDQVKIYIAGKITGNPDYKEQFAEAERHLRAQGHTTMNPAVLPDGFEHHEYMKICFAMIDACDAVYLQENWRDSIGATMERNYAIGTGKVLVEGGK